MYRNKCDLLMGASHIVLALPVLLFIAGWYNSLIFLAAIVCTTFYAFRLEIGFCESPVPRQHFPFLKCFGAILGFLIISGMIGFFPTHGDSWAFRQALYVNLTQENWPLILPNGKEMTYYLAGMLPPAAMAKFLPESMQQLPVALCTALPITLALCLFFRKWGHFSWLFVLLALGFQDPLRVIFRPNGFSLSGLGSIAQFLQSLYNTHGWDFRILTSFYGNQTLLAPIRECLGAYNSIPYTLLAAAIIMTVGQRKWLVPYTMAMLAFVSPLGAIALFPLAACVYLRERELKLLPLCIECSAPAVLALLAAVYYGRTETGPSVILPAWEVWGGKFTRWKN